MPLNETITGVHPLHLHGMSFWVMAQGPAEAGAYDAATGGELKPLFVRDVAVVQAGSYIVIRFTSSNPGLWMFHCMSIDVMRLSDIHLAIFFFSFFSPPKKFDTGISRHPPLLFPLFLRPIFLQVTSTFIWVRKGCCLEEITWFKLGWRGRRVREKGSNGKKESSFCFFCFSCSRSRSLARFFF